MESKLLCKQVARTRAARGARPLAQWDRAGTVATDRRRYSQRLSSDKRSAVARSGGGCGRTARGAAAVAGRTTSPRG
jgi:hypothetical protein